MEQQMNIIKDEDTAVQCDRPNSDVVRLWDLEGIEGCGAAGKKKIWEYLSQEDNAGKMSRQSQWGADQDKNWSAPSDK